MSDLILPKHMKPKLSVPIMAVSKIPKETKIMILKIIADGIINQDAAHADKGLIQLMMEVDIIMKELEKKKSKKKKK
jgi:hypothetical protein